MRKVFLSFVLLFSFTSFANSVCIVSTSNMHVRVHCDKDSGRANQDIYLGNYFNLQISHHSEMLLNELKALLDAGYTQTGEASAITYIEGGGIIENKSYTFTRKIKKQNKPVVKVKDHKEPSNN